ncbi:antirestriction protein ArdC [Pedobacter sp. AK017]|uniref:ArdC family protein n=1 Tax=Pedobacter sp. AK017 TaxID=2723073 RepID=UPI00160F6A28|nr:zincin-like metallopeptidase domain-containing protein [Pedobacter sp. AK017]MBB5440653.1 antirestriction protein ArdC [Pedobacter sp. AK017]
MSKQANVKDGLKALHVQVAEKLIEQLKAGTAPWQKPWKAGQPAFEMPFNPLSGTRYKGINAISLLISGYNDPRWMTFKQASAENWKIRKGEKSSIIQYVKLSELVTKRDEQGKPVLEDGKEAKVLVKLEKPIITSARVFNAEQIEGIPERKSGVRTEEEQGWNPIERVENLVQAASPKLHHREGDRAFYTPLIDTIIMPLRSQFDTGDKYYATLLHELAHWTGHPERLDRGLINKFGTELYAREELRAEIASMILGQEMQIGHDPGQHAAYVQDWVKILTNHPYEIHAAASDAEKMVSYLLAFERKRNLTEVLATEQQMQASIRHTASKTAGLGITDVICYNEKVYKVASLLKGSRFRMEELTTGQEFVLAKTDGLYQSLVQAKTDNHPLALERSMLPQQYRKPEENFMQVSGQTEPGNYSMKR